MYETDYQLALSILDIWLEGWEGLPIGPRLALISLAYNLGGPRLASFVKLRAALRAGDLPAAANQALDSKWAGQVGHHVKNKRQVEAIMTAVRGKIDEGLSGEMEMQKLSHQRQHQLNQIALQKRSLFLSGWRPLAGWSCALGVAWVFLGAPIVQMAATSFGIDIPLPELPTDYLFELLLGLLGMAGIRSFDKLKGNSG